MQDQRYPCTHYTDHYNSLSAWKCLNLAAGHSALESLPDFENRLFGPT
jgi:hypothetical protein